jgi:hypothetical protein
MGGADLVLRRDRTFVRAEYLARWTELALGDDPVSRFKYGPGADGRYDTFSLREGFYLEAEHPIGRVELIARWDGLRRKGNVAATSALRSDSAVLRYTLGTAIRIRGGLRIKTSVEAYDFSDFDDELATHLGIVGPFPPAPATRRWPRGCAGHRPGPSRAPQDRRQWRAGRRSRESSLPRRWRWTVGGGRWLACPRYRPGVPPVAHYFLQAPTSSASLAKPGHTAAGFMPPSQVNMPTTRTPRVASGANRSS